MSKSLSLEVESPISQSEIVRLQNSILITLWAVSIKHTHFRHIQRQSKLILSKITFRSLSLFLWLDKDWFDKSSSLSPTPRYVHVVKYSLLLDLQITCPLSDIMDTREKKTGNKFGTIFKKSPIWLVSIVDQILQLY